MDTELYILYFLLLIALILAPILSNDLLLQRHRFYRIGHIISVVIVLIGILSDATLLVSAWILFCIAGLILHFIERFKGRLTLSFVATNIPFLFSIIGSVWFFSGVNDLYLLGYNEHWSLYAAMHSMFLGWMYIGCLAHLASNNYPNARIYTIGCCLCLVLFLFVAFGINGIPHLKSMGAIGLSILVPFYIFLFCWHSQNTTARLLGGTSIVALLYSMTLALMNEFWIVQPPTTLGINSMVTLHGIINAVIVIPCFYVAVRLNYRTLQATQKTG